MSAPQPAAGRTVAAVEKNIDALLARRQQERRARTLADRISDRVSAFAGSMPFVLLHACGFGLWIAISRGWTPLPRWDPTLVTLAMFASVEAICLSTFILITQNRMARLQAERADPDLQISLLAEHEITRMLTLVRALAAHFDIAASERHLVELLRDVPAEEVLEAMARRSSAHGPDV